MSKNLEEKINKKYARLIEKRFEYLKTLKDEGQSLQNLLRYGAVWMKIKNDDKRREYDMLVIKIPNYNNYPFVFKKENDNKYYLW